MIIKNNSKHTIVLKAVGLNPLRLFPGYNTVKNEGVEEYFKTEVAKANQKAYLSVVDGKDLSTDDMKAAKAAKKKNDELNKAQRVVRKQNEKLAKNDDTIKKQTDEIEGLKKLVADLQKEMKKPKPRSK